MKNTLNFLGTHTYKLSSLLDALFLFDSKFPDTFLCSMVQNQKLCCRYKSMRTKCPKQHHDSEKQCHILMSTRKQLPLLVVPIKQWYHTIICLNQENLINKKSDFLFKIQLDLSLQLARTIKN